MSGLSANLEKQYDAWLYSVEQQAKIDNIFVERWFSLASAYQKRYLARRAVQARNPKAALKLITQALITNPRILIEEPSRTLVTLVCSLFCMLPEGIYKSIENIGIRAQQKMHTS